jgi:pilus assembly protein CpaB
MAAALGLAAAVLAVVYLDRSGGDTSVAGETQTIVSANQRIEAGDTITASMLTTRQIPVGSLAPDMYRDSTLVEGRIARYPIEKGEAISTARLVDAPKVQSLSFQIPRGLRGMTIPVEIEKTPAALIAPGDFVDVIVSVDVEILTGRVLPTPTSGNKREYKGAHTLLQNIQVLSVERNYVDNGVVYEPSLRGEPPEEKDKVTFVTLAVTPDQAQLLWLAQDQGSLTIVLRAFGDDAVVPLVPKLEPLTLP